MNPAAEAGYTPEPAPNYGNHCGPGCGLHGDGECPADAWATTEENR